MPLLLVTPAAEPLVGRWRAEHDWAARHGIPAHVTIRLPFLPPEQWRDPSIALLLEGLLPVDVTLSRLEDRPGALVILAEPDDQLRAMTEAVSAQWPELAPHKGNRPDVAYHVTVVRAEDRAVRAAALDSIAPQLPLRVVGSEVWAAEGSAEGGVVHAVLATTRKN